MKKLIVSTLVISGLTLTGVSSFALNEHSGNAQTEQMQEGAEHAAKTKEIRGTVTKVQDSAVEIKDEAGKTHLFDTTSLQNLEELQAETLEAGDSVRVELEDGQATMIKKVEAKSDASSVHSSDTSDARTYENEGMNKENELSLADDTPKEESSMPSGRFEGTESSEIAGEGEYVVKEGDTLGDIAEEQLGSKEDWKIIARANDIENPDMIYVGQRLTIPSEELNREEAPEGDQHEPMEHNTEDAPTAPESY